MDCEKTRRLLHEYFEGLSSGEEKALVGEHLASCADCRAFLEDLRQTVLRVKELEEVEPPAWLTRKVMARIKEEHPVRGHLFGRLFRRFPAGLPVAAAATVVVAVFSVILMRSMQPDIGRVMPPVVAEKRQPASPHSETSVPAGAESQTGRSATRGKVEVHGERAVADRQRSVPEHQRLSEPREPTGSAVVPAPPAAVKAAGASPQDDISKENSTQGLDSKADSERPGLREKATKAGRTAGRTYERSVELRHADGAPEVIVTYEATAAGKKKIMEERFDEQGGRHGAHIAYDNAGRPWVEVRYEHGRIDWIREYDADGTLRRGKSGHPWPWLRPDLK
ncbi:MAG: zf-HC2 domain-containing protein [Nitrospiraceae bacterium]|nr:zf-HC2 domain-containing protein [Nitrospiraceae bacterium]